MREGPFAGRVALVTGASRGIGLAIAREVVDGGGRVTITARGAEGLAEAVEALGGSERALGVAGRSHDPEHRRAAVSETLARFGRLDALVNSAGTNTHFGPMIDADLAAFEKLLQINTVAALGWVQEAWRQALSASGGVVLNVASLGGLAPEPMIGLYNASKAALIHLTRQLAVELAPAVRVNALAPAVVKTRFARALYEDREDETAARYPLRRLGVPEDVARAARFLLSDDAAWITGETLVIDGGIRLARQLTASSERA